MVDLSLEQLKQKLEKVKRDLALKEGERQSVVADVLKQFDVKTLDAAYAKLDELQEQRKSKQVELNKIKNLVQEKLTSYGY